MWSALLPFFEVFFGGRGDYGGRTSSSPCPSTTLFSSSIVCSQNLEIQHMMSNSDRVFVTQKRR